MARAVYDPPPGRIGNKAIAAATPGGLKPKALAPRIHSPSKVKTHPDLAPVRRAARSAMTSKTGCVSVTEPLMTRSTSEVAVWRSSASFVSLNRRVFSIAITAWSAKATFSIAITAWSANVCSSAICLPLSAPGVMRTTAIAPIAAASRTSGTTVIAR